MNELDLRREQRAVRCLPGCAAALLLGAMAVHALAQGAAQPVIYPSKGQSARQQDQDRYECHAWARERAGGYDPTQPVPVQGAASTSRAATSASGAPVGGMAAGAMGGAAVAELTHHDAGHGAAAGALGGAVIQRVKQNQAAQRQQAQQQLAMQQDVAMRNQQRATYDRGFSACMEGRGYTVK